METLEQFKLGFQIFIYKQLLGQLPDNVNIVKRLSGDLDMIHFFTKASKELMVELKVQMMKIKQNSMIWVSWPKKSSRVETDITEDVIWNLALPMGVGDVKVYAMDDVWSGL